MFPIDQTNPSESAELADDHTQLRDMPANRSSNGGAALAPKVLKSRFVLQDQLGSGGMGTVYRAKDLRKVEARDSQPYLAIKVLNSDFREHPDAFIALQREAAKSQSLSHRNIVKIFDFDKEGDVPFMTMELLQGNELSDLLREYPQGLPQSLAWPVIRGFCSALKHAHAEGVIHADLKPGNLFVTHAGQVKIFDFGLARAVQSNFARGVFNTRSDVEDLIFDTAALGALTPAFASRAMLQGDAPNASDDVYAAALVIYQVLTGKHPYNRIPADKVDPRSVSLERPKQLSSRQWRVLSQALALDEANRLPSVAALQAGLFERSLWPMRLLAMSLGFIAVTLWYFNLQKDDQILEVQQQAQQAGRVEAGVERIVELINKPVFDEGWERRVNDEINRLAVLENSEVMLNGAKARVTQLYVQKSIDSADINLALQFAESGKKYGDMDAAWSSIAARLLSEFETQLDKQSPDYDSVLATETLLAQLEAIPVDAHTSALARHSANVSYLAMLRASNIELSQETADALLAHLAEREFDSDEVTSALEVRSSATERVVDEIRRDQERLDIEGFGQSFSQQGCLASSLNRLQDLHNTLHATAISSRGALAARTDEVLEECVLRLNAIDPDAAASLQRDALDRFGSLPRTQAVRIDPCDRKFLIGSGAQRGRAGMCIDAGQAMPELVVVPGPAGPFAITRYEISNEQYQEYCRANGLAVCSEDDSRFPVTGKGVAVAVDFAKWLSQESGYNYRLPSLQEWLIAATPDGQKLDANRNCKVDIGGISRGGAPIAVSAGKPNQYGLVNAFGNASEWVTDAGALKTIGGSFDDAIDRCTSTEAQPSSGEPEQSQGFRLVREIEPRRRVSGL